MNRKGRHISKSPEGRQHYMRTLGQISSDPTIPSEFDFQQSDSLEEEDLEPNPSKRPRNAWGNVQYSWKSNRNNLITPLIIAASVAIVILILNNIMDIREHMGRVDGILQNITNTISKHDNEINKIKDDFNEQQYDLYQQGVQLEELEEKSKE